MISNLVHGGEEFHMQLIDKGLLQIIVDILHLSDVIMINFALKITWCILEYEKEMNCSNYQEQLKSLGAIDKFYEFCDHENRQIQEFAVCIVEDYYSTI